MSDATAVLGFSEVTLWFLSGSGGLTEISLFNSLCYDFLLINVLILCLITPLCKGSGSI